MSDLPKHSTMERELIVDILTEAGLPMHRLNYLLGHMMVIEQRAAGLGWREGWEQGTHDGVSYGGHMSKPNPYIVEGART